MAKRAVSQKKTQAKKIVRRRDPPTPAPQSSARAVPKQRRGPPTVFAGKVRRPRSIGLTEFGEQAFNIGLRRALMSGSDYAEMVFIAAIKLLDIETLAKEARAQQAKNMQDPMASRWHAIPIAENYRPPIEVTHELAQDINEANQVWRDDRAEKGEGNVGNE